MQRDSEQQCSPGRRIALSALVRSCERPAQSTPRGNSASKQNSLGYDEARTLERINSAVLKSALLYVS